MEVSVHSTMYCPESMSDNKLTKCSAPIKPTPVSAMHRCIHVSSRAIQKGQRLVSAYECPVEPTPYHRMNRCLCKKMPNGYKRTTTSCLWAIYIASPVILDLLEFLEVTPIPKSTSKPSKSLVIKSLVLSTPLRVLVLD